MAVGDPLVFGRIETCLFFAPQTKEEGLLLSEKLPNTELKLSNTQYVEYYGAEGIRIHPVEPMREWVLEYEGKMR